MHTLLTVIRKKPEIATEEFRRFMKEDYGPTYLELPQTRAYVQYFLADLAIDDAEDPIDAIVQISFDSVEQMTEALQADSYQRAHELRQAYMRETSVGIHSAVVEETNRLV
ncbi:EthD domain-containing protein [Streptomyces sp. SID13031]|uniref:EthD domain-containing protein n=1 Tax=Streptomyces sp. SID13031 TaxID=2706046 RepID=UPI0013C6C04C|nr:EthD domain-containing protein [Streptomyces sp. SID13031]NEA32108.1 EthD domain-containing protein [Streptomyces sp. SID13031]